MLFFVILNNLLCIAHIPYTSINRLVPVPFLQSVVVKIICDKLLSTASASAATATIGAAGTEDQTRFSPKQRPSNSAEMTTLSSRPVLTSDPHSREGSWDDWIDHFESVAEVNKWDGAAKLLWLRVRLTGRAQTAFKQLSEEARAAYAECKKALWERFEPASKKELYLAEFQTRSKRATEGWAAFAAVA